MLRCFAKFTEKRSRWRPIFSETVGLALQRSEKSLNSTCFLYILRNLSQQPFYRTLLCDCFWARINSIAGLMPVFTTLSKIFTSLWRFYCSPVFDEWTIFSFTSSDCLSSYIYANWNYWTSCNVVKKIIFYKWEDESTSLSSIKGCRSSCPEMFCKIYRKTTVPESVF